MDRQRFRTLLHLVLAVAILIPGFGLSLAQTTEARVSQEPGQSVEPSTDDGRADRVPQRTWSRKRTTQAERQAAADRAKAAREAAAAKAAGKAGGARAAAAADGRRLAAPAPGGLPDYFGIYSNWANSPPLRKFVDTLSVLGSATPNTLGQFIPVANPDIVTYPGSDYYEISLVEYNERMHSDLPPTRLRGYVQTNSGTNAAICGGAGQPACAAAHNTLTPATVHYLGPVIVAARDRPVRVKFTDNLPVGVAGKHFLPVDVSVMGAGPGPAFFGNERAEVVCASLPSAPTPADCYTENRATIHLHGGKTPWISDGTPHQWITPAGETTTLTRGASVFNVPDMPEPGPGSQTFYFTNQQSARMMFYHDHASGITRLNVYAGGAAGYLITDQFEKDLVDGTNLSGVNPSLLKVIPADQIPLVIQDKTFVNANLVPSLVPGDPPVPAVRQTDPTWNWGTGPLVGNVRTPVTGDLWWPHVYVTAQNPYDISGVNPWGRWAYGPWFWPPTANIKYPPVPNPLYDPNCDPDVVGYCQPPYNAGTPNVSWGAEAFLDTPVINGTAYPSLAVQPKPYRFRILNAAHDRFWNLQLYRADPAVVVNGMLTEVKMVPAVAPFPPQYPTWPTDGRPGGVPDPTTKGPDFIQIGTEGGFLPRPVAISSQPVSWNTDPTTFNFGNVTDHGLLLGPAERADVIVDFTGLAGQTLILYNDAPAAFPAIDPRNDYYTGAPDLRDTGGVFTPQAGYGPNTRTIMRITVGGSATAPCTTCNLANLNAVFTPAGTTQGVFQKAQEPIIVGQKTYNAPLAQPTTSVYKTAAGLPVRFPNTWPNWGVSRIQDNTLSFKTVQSAAIPGSLPLSLPMAPKAIHDEMGAVYDQYGRMSAKIGIEMPLTTNLTQNFVVQAYIDPTTENVVASAPGGPVAGDGTQIWKITHNGVDTHPVHFHIFDVQLINRVGWDGSIRLPDDNELGWKDTIRISPLEDTIVALRPIAPRPPFGIPDSVRPLNPALRIGSGEGFTNINTTNGQPLATPTLNALVNFGWEYVWHCHILSHEEADMMRPIVLGVPRALPAAPVLSRGGTTLPVVLNWTDATPVGPNPAIPLNLGNPANEIGFRIERASGSTATPPVFGAYSPIASALANAIAYTDNTSSATVSYSYRVVAFNAAGEAVSNALTVAAAVTPPAAPTVLTANLLTATTAALSWTDNANNETGFRIERSTTSGFTAGTVTSILVGPHTTANPTTYTDTFAFVVGTPYYYRVWAVNGAVDSTAPSNTASVTLSAAPLAPPTNLVAQAINNVTDANVNLSWTNNWTGATGFTIQRATDSGFTQNLVTYNRPATPTTYRDNTGLVQGTTYYYRVQATGPGGPTAWSGTVSVGPPLAPSGLTATQAAGVGARPILNWTDNSTNETSFTIQRNGTTISTQGAHSGTGAMSYTDNSGSFVGGTTYTYQVRANNPLGNSAWSTAPALATHP